MRTSKLSLQKTLTMVAITIVICYGQVIAGSTDKPEEFGSFLKQFMADKCFSTARTLYPIPLIVVTEEGQEKKVVTKAADEAYPPLSEYIAKNQMGFNVETQKDQREILRVYAPNTGYSIRYMFILKRSCWFLESIYVVSI